MINDNNEHPPLLDNAEPKVTKKTKIIYVLIRASFIIISLIPIILNSFVEFALPATHPTCLIDYLFDSTSIINKYFKENEISRKAILICSNLLVDILLLILSFNWIMFSKSWRVFVSMFAFYLFKIFIQVIFQESIPLGNLWSYPGFPSIFGSYLQTNDSFYATSCGFLTIALLEFWTYKKKKLFFITIPILILDIFTRIILRENYSIDIVSGIILAHFIYSLSVDFSNKYIDKINN